MILYLDTSLLISTLTEEAATGRAIAWLHGQGEARKIISWWVEVEFAAALSMKVRVGAIPAAQRERVADAFSQLVSTSMEIVSVTQSHFEAATSLAAKSLGLRAGDALHLAIASEHAAILCTLDKAMAQAGMQLGLETELI